MLARTLTAGLFAALTMGAPGTAPAADLHGEGYQQPYDNSEYDDQDYRDRRHSHADSYDSQNYSDYSNQDYDEDAYRGRYRSSYKDGEYLEPMNRPPRYADESWRGREGCTPRWQIRQRMMDDGWRNIYRLRVLDNAVVIRAQRPSGRPFDLKLDRCTGDIVDRRPAHMGTFSGYAPEYRRYSRTY